MAEPHISHMLGALSIISFSCHNLVGFFMCTCVTHTLHHITLRNNANTLDVSQSMTESRGAHTLLSLHISSFSPCRMKHVLTFLCICMNPQHKSPVFRLQKQRRRSTSWWWSTISTNSWWLISAHVMICCSCILCCDMKTTVRFFNTPAARATTPWPFGPARPGLSCPGLSRPVRASLEHGQTASLCPSHWLVQLFLSLPSVSAALTAPPSSACGRGGDGLLAAAALKHQS